MIIVLWQSFAYQMTCTLMNNLYFANYKDNSDMLTSHENLYFLIKINSIFAFLVYSYVIINNLFFAKVINKFSIGLIFVYLKHTLDITTNQSITMYQYEIERIIMWLFASTIMLYMFCDINKIHVLDIKIHYHIIILLIHLYVSTAIGEQYIRNLSAIVLYLPYCLFMKALYRYDNLPFTKLYILIWHTFVAINLLEQTTIIHKDTINGLYSIADLLCKFVCNIVIANYSEREMLILSNIDLQCINFISYSMKMIKEYEKNNTKITKNCKKLIEYSRNHYLNKIPSTDNELKIELLKKLLPLNLDKQYMKINEDGSVNEESISKSQEFQFIFIMFMDIVNYTELAKKYNAEIIFKLLDKIYTHFDNIIKKYSHIQKIETIGDAYMVVGDIFREQDNHKLVVKELFLLSIEFLREIKTIKTPDDSHLSARIGMHMGTVHVGILGNEIPRLCVVGNSVNVANRLQTTAEADSIQMSRHVYEKINEMDIGVKVEYTMKENVFLKNIGSINTYNVYAKDLIGMDIPPPR
jgi:class 3 adenylate cyclase